MADVELRMNMAGLVELSNVINDTVARPLAENIAASAGDGYAVQSTARPGVKKWGRTRVFTATPAAMRREVRTGALARSLGGGR